MFSTLSILPEVGRGLWSPRFHGTAFGEPTSPCDHVEGRQETALLPLTYDNTKARAMTVGSHSHDVGRFKREDGKRGGLTRRLRIGCIFWSRKGTFCRVLHTQVLEVIDSTHPCAGFVISRSGVQAPRACPDPISFTDPNR